MDIGRKDLVEGKLKKEDFQRAKNVLREKTIYANTAIIHHRCIAEFAEYDEYIRNWYLSDLLRWSGPFFAGVLSQLKIYWTDFDYMEKQALVYDKERITVACTPLKVYFDNPENPSQLIVEKWCSSAPLIDDAVVKILL